MRITRQKTPTVIQMEATECGAAALGIILAYYGCYRPLEELRYQCGVSRSGCNAYNLAMAARAYGLKAHGYKIALAEFNEVDPPFIVHWKGNHFVVFEGCDERKVFINDPATGPRAISYEELKEAYKDTIISLTPGKSFRKEGSSPLLWNLIFRRLSFLGVGVFAFFLLIQLEGVALSLVPPAVARVFLDNILIRHMLSWKWELLSLFFFVILLQNSAQLIRDLGINRLEKKLTINYSIEFLIHLMRLPMLFFSQRFGGEIINRIALNNAVSRTLSSQVFIISVKFLLIAIYGIIMYQYDRIITSVGLAAGLMNIALFASLYRLRSNTYSRLQQDLANNVGMSIDAIQNIETIKMTGMEDHYFSKLMGYKTLNINNLQKISETDVWLSSLSSLFTQFSSIAVLMIGCWRIMEGYLSAGMLIFLQLLMASFLAPITQLILSAMQLQNLKIDIIRLNDVLQNKTDPLLDRRGGIRYPSQQLSGKIELREVTFGYAPLDKPLFTGLNITVEEKAKVALVGPTGSGKSTAAMLLCGLYEPWEGRLLFDGHDEKQIPRKVITRSLAWIGQDPFLISGTIRDNLTLWRKDLPLSTIIEAAQEAQIHDLIVSRERGYDTLLAEGGSNLSEGEKQRIVIARALLLRPSILVMDEATSALDSHLEKLIFKNIFQKSFTCILVTHRLSSVKNCDKIIVFDKGRVIQEGTHQQIKNASGLYRHLVELDLDVNNAG